MTVTASHRAALFLRMGEILQGHALFLDNANERARLRLEWLEIAPEVLREMDAVRLEKNEDMSSVEV